MTTSQKARWMFVTAAALLMPVVASADVSISVDLAPPAFPVYEQPAAPAPNYVWTPGYWAYSDVDGYYWVPGTWVLAPTPGYYWTPCYWGWSGGQYVYHDGYWGPHVGFYGGINYGYGYGGHGYEGGSWNNGTFVNRSYSNQTNVTVANASSFNGGPGGTAATPTPEEQAAANEPHVPPTSQQQAHVQAASQNPAMRASVNNGKPAVAATARPGEFSGKGVVAAKQAGAVPNAQASKGQPNADPQAHPTRPNPQAQAAQANPQAHQAQTHSQGRPSQPKPQTIARKPQAKPKPRTKPRPSPKPRH